MGMRQQVLWVPGSRSVSTVDFSERPFRVWTIYTHMDATSPPELPLLPVHNEGFFLEDFVHDWHLRANRFRYFSRIVDQQEGVWLLLEWKS